MKYAQEQSEKARIKECKKTKDRANTTQKRDNFATWRWKCICLMILMVMVVGCSSSTGKTDTYNSLVAQGYLVVGLDDTFAPMGFRDENNQLVGFDVDLATEVSNRLGIEFKFQTIDWSMKETELNNGNIDLIWNGYSITEARKSKVNFSTPYLKNRQVIVVLSNSTIDTKEQLAGKYVAVQKESSALDAVMADATFASALNGSAPIEFDTNLEVFMDLEAKRMDAIVVDEVLADFLIKQRDQENYRYLQEDFGEEEYGIGIRKTDVTLLEKINETMESMIADGSFDDIQNRWFAKYE